MSYGTLILTCEDASSHMLKNLNVQIWIPIKISLQHKDI